MIAPRQNPLAIAGLARGRLLVASLCAAFATIAAIGLLGVSGWFLTAAALAGAAGTVAVGAFNYLIPSALIRLLAIVRTVARYGERLLSHKVALEGMAALRGSLFDKLAAQDSRSTKVDTSPGEASNRLIDDVAALEDLVIREPARHAALVSAAVSLGAAVFAGIPALAFLALMLAALPLLFGTVSHVLTQAPAEAAAEALGDLRRHYIELAASRAEIATYGLADQAMAELEPRVARLDHARARLFRAEALQGGLLTLYGAFAMAGVLLLAQASAPIVALVMLATASAVEAMGGFARSLLRRASLDAGLRRIAALDALDPTLPEPLTAQQAATITLGARSFAPGSRVALTGPSGSGKTRALLALAGMQGPAVPLAIDGIDASACTARQLSAQFALSPQDAPLLIGTVADNLRLARTGLTEAEMWDALDAAQLKDRISRSEAGLDTLLGEGGGTFSGGERKRLSLARALLARRPWLLLDEPSEGLDARTEAALVQSLGAWLERTGTGLVLVSHRPAPLALCKERVEIGALT
ncbi:ATP-binding cassette subfamily C protein CydC [Novosphingobium sp. PhB165]|uniref:ATP-binding cassette domain-containing protein n=1 Tax=Novosphingobium sp. PhB165 TaxID=2485105 RepID=UPI0010CE263C|nr:ATP-binding cassette domain-containing protein [Novosphingobium sp. PhB165]TCM18714.1 ATP-binding cassette subfamily C protein CydC [Novosphingobium sp. PhB165]